MSIYNGRKLDKSFDFTREYYDEPFEVICVFDDKQEHYNFIEYIKNHTKEFQKSIDMESIDEVPPEVQKVNSIGIYKTGKVMVKWLCDWRYSEKSDSN